jgi:hypothetical protein
MKKYFFCILKVTEERSRIQEHKKKSPSKHNFATTFSASSELFGGKFGHPAT